MRVVATARGALGWLYPVSVSRDLDFFSLINTLRDPPRAHGVDMDISFWLMEAFSALVSLLVAVSLRHR